MHGPRRKLQSFALSMEPDSDSGDVPSPETKMGASVQNDNSIPQSRSTESEPKSESKRLKKLNKNRTRVSQACDNCARRKVKCDGNVPCMPCLLRGRSCEARKITRRKREPSSIQAKCEKLLSCCLPKKHSDKQFENGVDLMPCQLDPSSGHDETLSATYTAPLLNAVHANQSKWDIYLENFCRNAHPQYPILDLPTLRSRYRDVSKLLPLSPTPDFANRENQAEISQVLICLAIGKFCESSYSDYTKGFYTSGWGLYSSALHLHNDLLAAGQEPFDQLVISQTTILMAIYLCCVDETIRARRLLSIAILQLFSLNRRERGIIDRKSVLEDENLRRALCCSYVLERELGLESEDSFLIPDSTINKILTVNLGGYRLSPGRSEITDVPAPESERDDDFTPSDSVMASHIMAITLHAQATSGIWRKFHDDPAVKSGVDHFLIERLEMSVEEAHNIVEAQQRKMRNRSPLESKTEVLMQIKWCYLKLLVSWSILRQPQVLETLYKKNIERTKLTCIDLVYTILQALGELANEYPKFTFPYLHIHITTVELGLELIMEDSLLRECFGSIVLQELDSLSRRCFRTTTSARITRKILSIKQTARALSFTGTDTGIEGERRHFIPQELKSSQCLLRMPTSLESPSIHPGKDQEMLLHEHLSYSTNGSSPDDMLSTETSLSSNQSITYDSLEAVPGILTSIDASGCDRFQGISSIIQGGNSSLDSPQTDFSNTFNYGVPEVGLDPAALSALSNAGISPFHDP
ncbi:hypothetical protein PEBR_07204 [Penicillium brasilianum]|uniref:Zn(2)-C6 fungal-type domain-containing protein n=1 Tax=Penicillium brasilianum TaxID=104259 RepID=A0A1S9RW75_PENBI|nr:hypothetical protein PEBR_07204 [Penicillium brasilianum]